MGRRSEDQGTIAIASMLSAWEAMPDILSLLRAQGERLRNIEDGITKIQKQADAPDRWLDAKAAAEYLGVSAGTFDKYRYKTNPRITGHALDGKTLYKKSELDNFVRLYQTATGGVA